MRLLERARAMRDEPVIRSAFALIVNTFLNAVLGFAYWVIAARLYTPDVVGGGAAAVSAMLLVSSIGWIGLQHSLMRFLPVAGTSSGKLIRLVYVAALAVALPAGVVFVVIADATALPSGLDRLLTAALFIAAVGVWVVFSLQDAVLIGSRRSTWVPVENSVFGVAKIVVLVALAATASSWAILGSWVVPAAALVLAVSALLVTRVLPGRSDPPALPSRSSIARFAAGHQAVALVSAAPDSILPLIVVALLGPEQNAFYYVAWTLSFSLRLVAVNVGSALTVEGSASQGALRRVAGHLRVLLVVLFVPMIVGVWVFAEPVLSVFGGRYSAASTDLLRIFALGLAPFTAVTLFVAAERVHRRWAAALGTVSVSTALTIALTVALLPGMGIVGGGIAWTVAQAAALVVVGGVIWARRRRGESILAEPSPDAAPVPRRA